MPSYAVHNNLQDAGDRHSDHAGSSDHGTFFETRSNPETHESRSNPETEYAMASEHSSWSFRSHNHTINEIKKLLDITDDDHERLLKEIKNLKTARQMAINTCEVLNSENDSLLHAKHNLEEEVEQLQDMLGNINTHVTAFMENYMSLHGEESENASRHASHHGTTHDHASQARHAAGSRNTDRDPQQPHEDTSVRSRLEKATEVLKNWHDTEDFAHREPHAKHVVVHDRRLVRETGHA
jgi:DNA repair exonuclease SbcCD ATPase subunit